MKFLKRHVLLFSIVGLVVLFVLAFWICRLCTVNNYIKVSKEYVQEYYDNFSSRSSKQCFYQLNKNSCDILKTNYEVSSEDIIAARSRILGPVLSYEIIGENYQKRGSDKYIDFEILVKYQNAEVNERHQIIIEKDGQKSINKIEFDEDNVIASIISEYKTAMIMNDFKATQKTISGYLYSTRTEKSLENMISQANILGGKLWGCEIIKDNYIFEQMNNASYVYEILLKMKYENMEINNKIKISEQNGKLGIGYTVFLPEKVLLFFENYTASIRNNDKDNILSLYNSEVYGKNEDDLDKKWNRLLTYTQAYGELTGYDILSFGVEEIQLPDNKKLEGVLVEAIFNYSNRNVKYKFILSEDANGEYTIFEEHISDD